MVIDKGPFWNRLVDYYYDNVHWEKEYVNIYDWLEGEYTGVSNTGSKVIKFSDNQKATWFILKHGS